MEHIPETLTQAEYALAKYADILMKLDYSYVDIVMQTSELIETLGYSPELVADICGYVLPDENAYDANLEVFNESLYMIPVELLTLPMPGTYGKVTDAWMDEALEVYRATVSDLHEDCHSDQYDNVEPSPACEEEYCPVSRLRDRLLKDIADPEVIAMHVALNDESMTEVIDHRIRLVYACQRAQLLTPAMAGTTITMLYDSAEKL